MTPQLDRALEAFKVEFATEINNGDITHLGISNCRTKNNKPGGPWSEHSWPNAVDVMIRNWSGRKALGDRIAAWMRAHPELWSEVFWWITFHWNHVHGTAAPRMNFDNQQIPPCAGGPAIPQEDETMQLPAERRADVQALINEGVVIASLTWYFPTPGQPSRDLDVEVWVNLTLAAIGGAARLGKFAKQGATVPEHDHPFSGRTDPS